MTRRSTGLDNYSYTRRQSGRAAAEDAVAGGNVCSLLEYVVVLGGLGGVFNLAELRALGQVGDVLDLLLADVACGLVGAHRGADL